MTRSSAVWATSLDDKQTSSRASISLPFDNARDEDDAEEDYVDAEAGWYVPVSIFTLPIYLRGLKFIYFDDATKRCPQLSVT
eukprot:scaffold220676_cov71-Attheya_sp.AAC.1